MRAICTPTRIQSLIQQSANEAGQLIFCQLESLVFVQGMLFCGETTLLTYSGVGKRWQANR